MRESILRLINQYFLYSGKKNYLNYYKRIISQSPELGTYAEGEDAWIKRWKKYDKNLSPLSYRIFSRFIGPDITILPMELCVNYVEPILTPYLYRSFYRDKNNCDLIIPKGYTATALLRNMQGVYFDGGYNHLALSEMNLENLFGNHNKLMYKPSDSDSGKGIILFEKTAEKWIGSNGDVLNEEYLLKRGRKDFLIQACIEQSAFTAQFNPSSVNSFRVMTYRSVITGEITVPNIFFKIGGKGACVDNAHSGGKMCGVDDNGMLMDYVYDYLGKKQASFLGVDFKNNHFKIHNYNKLVNFAKEVAKHVLHHHLLALDIALDNADNPVLIEINASGFAGWAFQMSTGSIFKEYTDEVMDYCFERSKQLRPTITFKS